ncbi:MAG: CTP synthase [Anaerolineaceae bacterium]|jgi:CTP synthase|nr:CTP synthase [Anaerolineaceae bacterium]
MKKQNSKYLFFTGGVISSVGKGLTAASIGCLLKERGFSVVIQKLDPYLNVDPGTMSPYQHGEVFVLDDGSETDLDLGHYERFIDIHLTRESNLTSGQVYAEVISKERKGDYLGGTIQVIPHITDIIKRRIKRIAEISDADFVLVEVGGTVGDIESQPFLESLRQLRQEIGRDHTFFVHATWLPFISATGELKSKPTQHSVRELRSIGISPNMIIARADQSIPKSILEKISLFCDVDIQAVIPLITLPVLYSVPLELEHYHVAEYILNYFNLKPKKEPNLSSWKKITRAVVKPKHILKIALVGKYVELHDAYISVREALKHACLNNSAQLEIEWIHSSELEDVSAQSLLSIADGILVPGGFGVRGTEGKIAAAKYARENKIPYLGLCLGFQIMVIEFARYLFNDSRANSTEFDEKTPYPVIDLLPGQKDVTDKGGTMRLGLYPCKIGRKTIAYRAYRSDLIEERHRHRYELNNQYREELEKGGMVFSGQSPDGYLVEIAELKGHPFMLGSQFHPEFLSRPNRPHPLFNEFIKAVIKRVENK